MKPTVLAVLVTACILSGRGVRAQSADELRRAEVLFEDGSRLLNSGRYAEACPKLESARNLVAGIGVTLYLADCYERTGRSKSAWELFEKAEELATQKHDSRAAIARERARRLLPKLARLDLQVGDADLPGLVISDEEVPVDRAEWNVDRPVEPGTHHLRATAPGRTPWEGTVEVPAGPGTVEVRVPALEAASAPPPARDTSAPVALAFPAPAREAPIPERDRTGPEVQRLAGIALFGAGVIGIGVGSFFGLRAMSKLDDSNSNGHCLANDHCDAVGLQDRSDALTAATISTVGLAAGVACLAGGAILYLTTPKRTRSVAIAPLVQRTGPSVVLETRW